MNASAPTEAAAAPQARGSVAEVFMAFLKLGVMSFGGPIAHLGYYREELVVRRRWLDEATYADLVALCQFLPGPASSQVGFSLGVLRGTVSPRASAKTRSMSRSRSVRRMTSSLWRNSPRSR